MGAHAPMWVWLPVVAVCEGLFVGRFAMGTLVEVCVGSCSVAASVVVVLAGGRSVLDAAGVEFWWRGCVCCCSPCCFCPCRGFSRRCCLCGYSLCGRCCRCCCWC